MIGVKNNYKGKYQNLHCRGCGINIEAQAHVFKGCTHLHKDNNIKIKLCEIFSDNTKNKRETVNKANNELTTEMRGKLHRLMTQEFSHKQGEEEDPESRNIQIRQQTSHSNYQRQRQSEG